MNSLAIFVCLFAATAALDCSTCGEIDYPSTFNYTAYNLTKYVAEGMPLCSGAVDVTCNATVGETACGNALLGLITTSDVGGVSVSMSYNVTVKGCTAPVSCDVIAAASSAELDEGTVIDSCSGELCDGDGNCVTDSLTEEDDEDDDEDDDDSSATTMSLAAVGLLALRLF
jgi:hypothetical protein